MKTRYALAWLMPVVMLTGFAVASPAKTIDAQDSEQVAKLLTETKTLAFQVKEDAVTMESFTRMDVSWAAHVEAVAQMKTHVNALGRQVAKLEAAKGVAAPWQVIAINRISPFLDELSGYTSAAIERLNGDRTHNIAAYKDYLEANADYATDLFAVISDFVNYGNAKQRMERLSDKLEIER